MSTFLKATLIAIGSSLIFVAPAQAEDYTLKLRWDAEQTLEQNQDAAAEKIEAYCKMMVRRDRAYSVGEQQPATAHCKDQLISAFLLQAEDMVPTQEFAALTSPIVSKQSQMDDANK